MSDTSSMLPTPRPNRLRAGDEAPVERENFRLLTELKRLTEKLCRFASTFRTEVAPTPATDS